MNSQIRVTSGPAIERQGDLAAILTNIQSGDVLFIDEIHRLKRGIEEVLYPAMEDFRLDIVVGKGPSARSIRLKLPSFTLIGATTKIGALSSPLRDRFGYVQRLDYFGDGDLSQIVERAAGLLEVGIDTEAAEEIARRARGTARVALRLLKRVRDYAQVKADSVGKKITEDVAIEALKKIGVDDMGLDELDRKILRTIIEKFNGGPVGLSTIAASLSEEIDTISDVYEPFLLQKGLMKRTARGRVATEQAYTHLGIEGWDGDDPDKLG
jgi:Holliday junction DNA helicase RuvB